MNSIKTYVEGKSLKVFFIISYKGKRFQVYTGITSTVKFSGMVFPKSVPNARAKTAMLARLFASVEEYVYMNGDLPVARMKDDIKSIINGRAASVEKNILYYIDEFIKTKARESTKEIFLRTRKRIESFDEHADFDNIDRDWLERFQAHELLKGRMSGGIAIDLRNIRTVFNWAIDNEITTKYPFRKFSIKTERQQYLYLSAEEMREYRDFPVEPFMEKYRDLFMLGFYLIGINLSDLLELPADCIKRGRIQYKRNKTGRLYDIKVEPEAMEIIARHKSRKKDRLLNFLEEGDATITNTFANNLTRHLRTIGEKERHSYYVTVHPIEEGITSYWSRHTWATMASELDIPMEVIGRSLGHSLWDNAVTSTYIKYDTKKIDEANRKVIDYLNADLECNKDNK